MSHTAAQIIGEKGGASAVAAALGRTPGAIRLWKHRNVIPRHAWPDLMIKFPDITLARLIATEAAATPAESPKPARASL